MRQVWPLRLGSVGKLFGGQGWGRRVYPFANCRVATPLSPAVAEPLDHIPMSPLEGMGSEEDMCPETASEDPDCMILIMH